MAGAGEKEKLCLNRNCRTALLCATPGGIFPLLAPISKDQTVKTNSISFPTWFNFKSKNMASPFLTLEKNGFLKVYFLVPLKFPKLICSESSKTIFFQKL